MSHFLDIIIPEYDCPIEFMTRLLDSINKQKNIIFKEIGIIIINDKSKNKYKKSWFKQRYPKLNIEYLIKDINEGQGLTRQYGLDRSEALYVTFIDQDDMLYEYDNLSKIINYIKEHNDNIIFTEYIEETHIDNKIYMTKQDPLRLRCLHGLFLSRVFLLNNNIRFSNQIRYHEDVYICDLLYLGYDWVKVDVITYLWKWNNNSQVRKDSNTTNWCVKTIEDYIKSSILVYESLPKDNKYRNEYIVKSIISSFIILQSDYFKELEERRNNNLKELFNYYKLIKCDTFDNYTNEQLEEFLKFQFEINLRSMPKLNINITFNEYVKKYIKGE